MMHLQQVCVLLSVVFVCEGLHQCIDVIGRVECAADQSRVVNTELIAWDRDSVSPFDMVDGDDKIGHTIVFTEDGEFELKGCAHDRDWLPGIVDNPIEPYITITHRCGGSPTTITLGEFSVFMPRQHNMGTIQL